MPDIKLDNIALFEQRRSKLNYNLLTTPNYFYLTKHNKHFRFRHFAN